MSPRKEELALFAGEQEQASCCGERQGDDWSELTRSEELNPWMMAKSRERYDQARQEDDQRKSIVQRVTQRSTDFSRASSGQFRRREERTCALIATVSRSKTISGGSRWGTNPKRGDIATGGAR